MINYLYKGILVSYNYCGKGEFAIVERHEDKVFSSFKDAKAYIDEQYGEVSK